MTVGAIPVFLYLFALYVRPQDWVPGMIGLPTAFIIIPLGLVIGFINRMSNPASFRTPQTWLLIIYLVVIFISTLINVDTISALQQFDMFLRRILIFYMVIWLLSSTKRLELTIWFILLLSAFLAYQAILQAHTGLSWGGMTPEPGYEEIRVRWHGDWDGPNVFAILFVVACGLALEYIFGPHRLITRLIALGCAASYVTAIFYTNSRGAILALGCMVLFYFRNRFKSIFSVALGAALVGALLVLGPSRMSEVSSGESSAHERTWLWEQGLTMLRNNPIWGIGRGEFVQKVDLHLLAHSNYVQNFAETGLLGFFCFISLLWFCFKGNYLITKPQYEMPPQIVAQGRMMNASLMGYATATFFVVMELDMLYFFMGLWTAVYLNAARQHPSLPKLAYTRNDLILVGAGMLALLFMIWLAAVKQIL